MERQDQLAAERELALKGSWVDAPAHTTLMLVDAPHPVVDTQVMAEQVLRGQ